ncbi:MAG: hypothetical protein L0Y72_08090 [Gemmataceae bacterium]|nr:hypothetical protein [Gemmataceae bacterium]MCI0738988.1 hypothetical protein [Gemmataceae bacterium]
MIRISLLVLALIVLPGCSQNDQPNKGIQIDVPGVKIDIKKQPPPNVNIDVKPKDKDD